MVVVAQFFAGAYSSLAMDTPGVGTGAGWVPNVLVGEAFTILPIGYILCLWGPFWGRGVAALCACASIVLALAASIALAGGGSAAAPFGFPLGFAFLAIPGVGLIACILLRQAAAAREVSS